MKAAVKSIDITPPIGLPMGGNVRDDDISRGIHDNLYCNAILLEEEGKRFCFLSFDLLGLNFETCKRIKDEINKKAGIAPENIVINATHTHSGPDVLGIFRKELDKGCGQYINDITKKISDEIGLLPGRLEEAEMFVTKDNVYHLSFNRRLIMKDGSVKMNWEDVDIGHVKKEAGPIDPELIVISINNLKGEMMALMVNFTLHPAVLVGKDWLWSRDYINYLDNYIKEKYGNHVIVFFANGAEGNVNHINFRDKNQGRGFEEAKRIGELLGSHVSHSLEKKERLETKPLKILSKKISLPLRPITKEAVEWAKKLLEERGDYIPSLLDGVPDEVYAREILKLAQVKEKDIITEIQAVRLGDTIITTLPGEVFVEFGLRIKKESGHKNMLVFGLANDMVGYIPTKAAFDEGGYEIKTACSSKLREDAGDILTSEVLNLVKTL
ncbi:MAG: neutral/alkaline non-lysosomal ceramidase N-terminal domain-containing protein [Firmicutes bacterium]|nr:neutral/alkaline non-lysosomal ceramidase N-terminal domain-containing protein [Bacillota bacterium]